MQATAAAQLTLRKERAQYWQSYRSSLNDRSKSSDVWRLAKSMSGSNHFDGNPYSSITAPTIQPLSNTNKANLFAQHYASVSSDDKLNQRFLQRKNKFEERKVNIEPKAHQTTNYLNTRITIDELKRALYQHREPTLHAPCGDAIPYQLLKHLSDSTILYLLQIYNKLWHSGTSVPEWSNSIIMPIHKPTQRQSKSGFLPAYCPYMLTLQDLRTHRHHQIAISPGKNNIISPHQSGFRKNRLTLDQLLQLHNAAHNALRTNQYTRAIFLDYSKAFDLVWTEGLLFKLRRLKLHGNLYNCIKQCLHNRTLQVRINGQLSNTYKVANGLPQGSVIAPLLFLIYIIDIPISTNPNSHTSIFADDCAIWQSSKNLVYLTSQLQKTMNKIVKWSHKWALQINPEKTVNILFQKQLHLKKTFLTSI